MWKESKEEKHRANTIHREQLQSGISLQLHQ